MRDNNASNNIYTAQMCQDLKEITNLTERQTKSFIDLITNAILHDAAMNSLDNTSGRITIMNIEIPNIGCITIKVNENKEVVGETIELEDEFRQSLQTAINTGKSPLIEQASKMVVDRIKNRYKSLI